MCSWSGCSPSPGPSSLRSFFPGLGLCQAMAGGEARPLDGHLSTDVLLCRASKPTAASSEAEGQEATCIILQVKLPMWGEELQEKVVVTGGDTGRCPSPGSPAAPQRCDLQALWLGTKEQRKGLLGRGV